ncbi:tetratricopeptide repeat protein [Sulfuricurvum sp.]|uniref:tetratricopeptide repeat protein n=1 Tax=Sulfuricurvum sp. TaxID=2025608 RepID=UPI002615185B|nr:tetratricopeptide repeat protein [Sulfuricurvum sp.]MDD4883970.1 tetratricopeptide repeat protein [Sulfuricurvum sp.]
MSVHNNDLKEFRINSHNRRQTIAAKKNLADFKNTWKLDNSKSQNKYTHLFWIVLVIIGVIVYLEFFQKNDYQKGLNAYEREDYTQASHYFEKACENGNTDGCFNLAQMYDQGEGFSENDVKAVEYFTKACDGNDFQGCFNLGMMYANGNGVTKNKFKAVELFDKACKGGEGNGCFNLAYAYNKGIAVNQNKLTAMKLYGRACELGVQEGCGNYDYISNQNF